MTDVDAVALIAVLREQLAQQEATNQALREVIELPAAPIAVVEHHLITRYCPACAAWKTPRLPAGMALGQSRIGVRLASLVGTLRTVHRLPLAQIQHLLETLYGLHLSVG